jgi:hypothetical protein
MPPRRAPSAPLPSTLVCGSYLALTVWNTVCPALCLIAIAALSTPLIPADGTAMQSAAAAIDVVNKMDEYYGALAVQGVYVCVRRLDAAQTGKYYQCANNDPAIVSTTQMCACGLAPMAITIEALPVTVCAPDADAQNTWASECASTPDELSTCYRLLGYWTGKPEVRADTPGKRWYNLAFLRDMNSTNLFMVWLICMAAPLGLVGAAALCCATTPTRYVNDCLERLEPAEN